MVVRRAAPPRRALGTTRGWGGIARARAWMRACARLRRLERVEEVFVADRAVALHRVGHADVVVVQLRRIARSTRVAMEEIIAAAHAADATFVAVELLLGRVVVVQVAHGAKVGAKRRTCGTHERTEVATFMAKLDGQHRGKRGAASMAARARAADWRAHRSWCKRVQLAAPPGRRRTRRSARDGDSSDASAPDRRKPRT